MSDTVKADAMHCLATLLSISHDMRRREEDRRVAEMCFRSFDALFEAYKAQERRDEEVRNAIRLLGEFANG